MMSKTLLLRFFSAACLMITAPLFSMPLGSLFSLSGEELSRLEQGQALIRQLEEVDKTSLRPDSGERFHALAQMEQLFTEADPNFLAEALFILPVEAGTEEEVMQDAVSLLSDLHRFDAIPYYSKQNGTWNKLFENTEILEDLRSEHVRRINVFQKMRPFKPTEMSYRYTYYPEEGSWLFTSSNSDDMRYKFMKAVDEEEMNTALCIIPDSGRIIFYGLGGAKAFNFFGMFGDRLDVAFLGRIDAFFTWFYEDFVERRQ